MPLTKLVSSSFLSDLDDADIESLYSGFSSGQFTKSASEYFKYVEKEVSEYLKGQLKKKLRDLWFEKTGTKDPIDWSSRYDTPILCMFASPATDVRIHHRKLMRIMH